ncbi:magnesium transporter CorA family protein [Actinokineospora inagensis]|uniref:magnesium transporter CorA family protein n=1 Tax=Actinokineospora inagensis TaxID=103730 RepID=UPI00040322AD|nr:magnesium transporter CorA family protein [Actinokineospora inagensis]
MTETRAYLGAKLSEKDFPVDRLGARLAVDGTVAWVDIRHTDEAALAAVAAELDLHELALEDARQRHQRPKLDHYRSHEFLAVYAVKVSPNGELITSELSVFLTDRAIVTVHDGFDMSRITHRWDDSALDPGNTGVLLHAILDEVVDGHLQAASTLDELIEDLEGVVFEDKPDIRELQRHAVRLRRSLAGLRRVVLPMRDIMTELHRVKGLVDADLDPYFADIRDHVAHAADWTESLRDHITALRETQLNIQSNRLNLIMKKVTGWAAIIAVPAGITGFYGQNVPIPGIDNTWSFWFSSTIIVTSCVGLYAMFKRKDWL